MCLHKTPFWLQLTDVGKTIIKFVYQMLGGVICARHARVCQLQNWKGVWGLEEGRKSHKLGDNNSAPQVNPTLAMGTVHSF